MPLMLLPEPKKLELGGGYWKLPGNGVIVLEAHEATRDFFAARRLADRLPGAWKIVRGEEQGEIQCHFDGTIENREGYRLAITPNGVDIFARAAAGTFYAMQTLAQIIRNAQREAKKGPIQLPCLTIEDWPDFARRGVYHDISRGKVPQLHTLLQLIDDLASMKINEFQLYVENVFEFRRHPQMYQGTTPLTAEEIMFLDEACRRRHIDFVPSLTSLGHFEKILSRPAFRDLAEAEPEDLKKQGIETWSDQPWSLCVTDEGAGKLLDDMYDEFLPNFSSGIFNICCDESWDLGKGRSKAEAERIGSGQLYVNWVNRCAERAARHGRKIQMWGDIIRHHPELIGQLPADATLLEWGYEADHDFEGRCKTFAEAGKQFYVAPGTSSWITLASRTKNAFGNIHAAASAGLRHGAIGLLNTDWGDYGHQQMLSVSLLAFAYGAAASWNAGKTVNPVFEPGAAVTPFLKNVSLNLFADESLEFASLAYELGLTYEKYGWLRNNASLEWYLLREKWDVEKFVSHAEKAGLSKVEAAVTKLRPKFGKAEIGHPDGDQIRAEFEFTCAEILHGVERTRLRRSWGKANRKTLAKDAAALAKEFKRLWLTRNKTSRMGDVLDEFARLAREYKMHAKA
jgi:hypothetical protein